MPYYIRDPKKDHNFDNHPFENSGNKCKPSAGLLNRGLQQRVLGLYIYIYTHYRTLVHIVQFQLGGNKIQRGQGHVLQA